MCDMFNGHVGVVEYVVPVGAARAWTAPPT